MTEGHGLLTGSRAVVTGGARGIGYQIVRRYLQEGADVVIADFSGGPEAVRSLIDELAVDPGRVASVIMDVTDPASVAAAADEAKRLIGPIDVVVANAGILVLAPGLETSLADWNRVLQVNLTGVFLTCQEFGRRMVARGAPGSIVIASSLFGVRGGVENSAYCASKFGVIGLMKCLAAELAPVGITVNAVCPGQIMTPMIEQLSRDRSTARGTTPESEIARLESTIPLGRLGDPSEIADTYVYLASPLARYTTGQELVVDGGVQVG